MGSQDSLSQRHLLRHAEHEDLTLCVVHAQCLQSHTLMISIIGGADLSVSAAQRIMRGRVSGERVMCALWRRRRRNDGRLRSERVRYRAGAALLSPLLPLLLNDMLCAQIFKQSSDQREGARACKARVWCRVNG